MIYFIVNPRSRTGRGKTIWKKLLPLLSQKQVRYEAYMTKYPGHAMKIAEKISLHNAPCTLVIVGGDGTVNEAVNGIADVSQITLGYIPTGSSNDFARSLSLPSRPEDALHAVLHPKAFRQIDVGTISYGKKHRSFAVSCGIGFDASICQEALKSNLKNILNRIGLGKLTYAGIAVKQLAGFSPFEMQLALDDTTQLHFRKTYFASVMNNPYEGGGLKMCPAAAPDDGRLDVCIIEGYPKLVILLLLPTAFFGLHTGFKHVHTYRCKKVKIEAKRKCPVHTDGESCSLQNSIEAGCAREKLRIIVK